MSDGSTVTRSLVLALSCGIQTTASSFCVVTRPSLLLVSRICILAFSLLSSLVPGVGYKTRILLFQLCDIPIFFLSLWLFQHFWFAYFIWIYIAFFSLVFMNTRRIYSGSLQIMCCHLNVLRACPDAQSLLTCKANDQIESSPVHFSFSYFVIFIMSIHLLFWSAAASCPVVDIGTGTVGALQLDVRFLLLSCRLSNCCIPLQRACPTTSAPLLPSASIIAL